VADAGAGAARTDRCALRFAAVRHPAIIPMNVMDRLLDASIVRASGMAAGN
jgi:hypothetical protein